MQAALKSSFRICFGINCLVITFNMMDFRCSLTTGFIIHPSGEVIPAIHVDLPLADLMEQTEDPPMKFAFSMQPLGKFQNFRTVSFLVVQTKHCILKAWTPLVIVKDQSSHLVYLKIMHKITNCWNYFL